MVGASVVHMGSGGSGGGGGLGPDGGRYGQGGVPAGGGNRIQSEITGGVTDREAFKGNYPGVFVDISSRRVVVSPELDARVSQFEQGVRESPLLQDTLTMMRDAVRIQERDARVRLAETREAVRSEGYPEQDDDVEYLLEDASGLSRSTYAQIKGALLERLKVVREVANTCWDAMDGLLQRQAALRPMPLSDVEAHRRFVIGKFLKARQEIINKYQSYLRNLKWLELASSRQRRGCLTARQNNILRVWLFSNFQNPYPEHQDKLDLARRTGLTLTQINNWFINARVRVWKPTVELMTGERMRRETSGEVPVQSGGIGETGGARRSASLKLDDEIPALPNVSPTGTNHPVRNIAQQQQQSYGVSPVLGGSFGPGSGDLGNGIGAVQRRHTAQVGSSTSSGMRRDGGKLSAGISKPSPRGAPRGAFRGDEGSIRRDDRIRGPYGGSVPENLPILGTQKGLHAGSSALHPQQLRQGSNGGLTGGSGGNPGYYGTGSPPGDSQVGQIGVSTQHVPVHDDHMQAQNQPLPHLQGPYQGGGLVFSRPSGSAGGDSGHHGGQGSVATRDVGSRGYHASSQNLQYPPPLGSMGTTSAGPTPPQPLPYFPGSTPSNMSGGQQHGGSSQVGQPPKYSSWTSSQHHSQQQHPQNLPSYQSQHHPQYIPPRHYPGPSPPSVGGSTGMSLSGAGSGFGIPNNPGTSQADHQQTRSSTFAGTEQIGPDVNAQWVSGLSGAWPNTNLDFPDHQ